MVSYRVVSYRVKPWAFIYNRFYLQSLLSTIAFIYNHYLTERSATDKYIELALMAIWRDPPENN